MLVDASGMEAQSAEMRHRAMQIHLDSIKDD
jgi:hypothetical protein